MRIKVVFEHQKNVLLPWDYQYAVQEWIYRTLSLADEALSGKLHDIGYNFEGKYYKLFGFSPWIGMPYKTLGREGMRLMTDHSIITISFLFPDVLAAFVTGLFMDQSHTFYFTKSQKIPVQVRTVELESAPDFKDGNQRYSIKTGAKLSIRQENQMHPTYIGPDEESYSGRFIKNLMNKLSASMFQSEVIEGDKNAAFRVLSNYKSQKINIPKDGKIIEMVGYKFDFELDANAALHRTLYYAGAGEECSMGMGWVEVLEKEE